MSKKYVLGVDVGGTNSEYGLVDREGNILYESTVDTDLCETAQDLVDHIHRDLDQQDIDFELHGIGIGAPNGNYYNGTIEFAPNLKWKGVIRLADMFAKKFDAPAILTNDANAAALGEKIYGNAIELNDFVTITLGTGLGSGVIVNGKLVYGHDGFAGEYGHIRVIPNGRQCGCGRKGCLETYASATGVVRSIRELESENAASSPLPGIEKPRAEDVFEYAEKGDPFAAEIIEFTAKTLGNSLADFTCFSSPKAFVLFGGIAQSGQHFADKVKKYMEDGMLNIYKNKVEIRLSSLHEKNAAVLGASSLAWDEIV